MFKKLIPMLSIVIALAGGCFAQERRVDEPISDELYAIVEKRAAAIRTELSSLGDHDWAGHYLQGDHHPTVFTITPKNGFLVTSSLHTFSPSWVNFGKVTYSDGRLTIYPELAKDQKSAHIMPTEYLVIKWDGYRHLVPSSELINFAYDVHSGSGGATVDYFTRGTEADPMGLPDLPKEYSKYLRMKPIVAKVVSVKEIGDYSAGAVVIDAGRKKGVIKGMSFFLLGHKSIWARLWVSEVFEDRAECQISGLGTNGDGPEDLWVKRGWRFSSRMPKNLLGW